MITYKTHYVKSGEDFSIIARIYLGDPTKWNVIAQANPQYPIRYVNGIPYVTLRIGDAVRVPITVSDPVPAPYTPPSVVDNQTIVVTPPAPTPPPRPPAPPADTADDTTPAAADSSGGGWMKWVLILGLGWVLLNGKKGRK
jgi:hypothetical protein